MAIKFAVGYPVQETPDPFIDIVRDYQEHIVEVYFAWPGMCSGRAIAGRQEGYVDWAGQKKLETDLRAFRKMGLKLDLLLNANCYGGRALSCAFENEVLSLLEYLQDEIGGIDIVTTASPVIAQWLKSQSSKIEVRASVNMRIGTIQAMRHAAGLFDSFYLQRDRQRNLAYVRKVKDWCAANQKGLCMLANSGCLRWCPAQTFHDNLVAHDAEIDEQVNAVKIIPHLCWKIYEKRTAWPAILQSTWIRPEDIHYYEDFFKVVKLATRMHEHPRMVINAYAQRRYDGNLLDLFEPGFGPIFTPYVIDNTMFPPDFFERVSTCDGECENCQDCRKTLDKVLVRLPG